MSDFRALTPTYSVAPQISIEDVAVAKAAGFAMIVNNRPDGEEAGQPDGDKLRVLPWSANNTAEHVQCAAKLLHATTSARLVLTQMGFEFVMPRAQRTTAVLRQGADNAPFFDRVTLLFSGVNTSAVDAWRHEDEINYNSTAAIRADTDRARAGPCAVARVEDGWELGITTRGFAAGAGAVTTLAEETRTLKRSR